MLVKNLQKQLAISCGSFNSFPSEKKEFGRAAFLLGLLITSQISHVSPGIRVSPVRKKHITRDIGFPDRGTQITRDTCFQGGGTHITGDMCFPGGGKTYH